jgi:predicted amidohydrolase
MRIGCLQFAPQVGDVDNNLNRADAVLSRADPDDLDLLVLPELAFSGGFTIWFFMTDIAACLYREERGFAAHSQFQANPFQRVQF